MKHPSYLALALALGSVLAGCGGNEDGPDDGNPNDPAPVTTGDPTDPPLVVDPPNPDPCNLDTRFPGDELCILPPAPDEGIQIRVGPADYDDPAALAPYLVGPGVENTKCFLASISEGGFHFLRQQSRMRPGSHHMLINVEPIAGQSPGEAPRACNVFATQGAIPGAGVPSRDFPNGELGPEDEGIARFLPADMIAAFQVHYVNTTDEEVLREIWVNLYKMPESEVKQELQGMLLIADLAVNIPAQTRQTTRLSFTPTLPEATRIFQMNAHAHAHTETFTVYRTRGTDRELVYKTYDWAEPAELTYNTVVQNAPPDDVAHADGGFSGLLLLEPGDKLEWECDVNNTTNAALTFANEAYTAEMCLLTGTYVSPTPNLIRAACFAGGCAGGLGF